jgi:hypothetical protein
LNGDHSLKIIQFRSSPDAKAAARLFHGNFIPFPDAMWSEMQKFIHNATNSVRRIETRPKGT